MLEMLKFSGVVKRYRSVRVLDGVSFSVETGTVAGLVGPNGSGKTTLARVLLGLARPDAGSALIDGLPYSELKHPAHRVGALLEPPGFHPNMTAQRHLKILALGVSTPSERVGEVLRTVGLNNVAKTKIKTFSLGMRQRLGLAGALLAEPDVLILDEPANGLDPEGIIWLRGFIRSFADAGGTVLVTSHQLSELTKFIDNVIVISRGRVIEAKKVRDVSGDYLEDLYHSAITEDNLRYASEAGNVS